MTKFAFIGAGSLQFTSSCIRDLLTLPAFTECEFALMDTNRQNLDNIVKVVQKILFEMGRADTCKISPTTDRAEALKGADGVLCTVFNGRYSYSQKVRRGYQCGRHEKRIGYIPCLAKYSAYA